MKDYELYESDIEIIIVALAHLWLNENTDTTTKIQIKQLIKHLT